MLSIELTERLQEFLSKKDRFTPFHQFVADLRQRYSDLLPLLQGFTTANEKWQGVANSVYTTFSNVTTVTRGRSMLAVIQASADLRNAIETVAFGTSTRLLLDKLGSFNSALDAFLGHPSAETGRVLLVAADDFGRTFDAYCTASEDLLAALEPEVPRGAGTLVIAIDGELSLEQIADYLDTVSNMYRRLASLTDIDAEREPLRVRKIESGSLLLDLAGNEHLVAVIAGVVTAFFGWGYRRYTSEGQVRGFPEKLASVEKSLQLREKLMEAGFNVEHIDAALRDAEKATSDDLRKLFGNRKRVRVNNEHFQREEPLWPVSFGPVQLPAPPPPKLLSPPNAGEE